MKPTYQDIKAAAQYRWPEIHTALGIDPRYLKNKHQPCPACGGKDRFRYADSGVDFRPVVLRGCFNVLICWFHCSASSDTGSKTIPAVGSVSHIAGVSGSSCSVSAGAGWLQARTTKAKSNTQNTSKARFKYRRKRSDLMVCFMVLSFALLPVFQNMNLIKSIGYKNTRAKFALCRLK